MQEQIQDQEMNLIEFINVIIKRKKIILSVFFISVITTAVISLLMPKVYKTTAVIQNGQVERVFTTNMGAIVIQNIPIIAKEEVEEIITSQNILSSVIKKFKSEITDITSLGDAIEIEDIEKTNFFRLIVEYKGADTSFKICRTIIDSYFDFGKPIYQERIELIDNQLKDLDNQQKNIQDDMENLRKVMRTFSLSRESDETTSKPRIIFLQESLSNYADQISTLTSKKDELNLIRINAKEFKVIGVPLRQKSPVRPNKRKIAIITGVISLILGIFLAFFMEKWDKSNK